MENLSYLFAAFTFVWLIIYFIIYRMSKRQKELLQEIQQIKRILDEKGKR